MQELKLRFCEEGKDTPIKLDNNNNNGVWSVIKPAIKIRNDYTRTFRIALR
jgi:hypothetical protein